MTMVAVVGRTIVGAECARPEGSWSVDSFPTTLLQDRNCISLQTVQVETVEVKSFASYPPYELVSDCIEGVLLVLCQSLPASSGVMAVLIGVLAELVFAGRFR